MRALAFDIRGEYGHFKKPYSPMSPVTFPLPPPPAVLGMLGAVLGLSKTEYPEQLAWARARIAIRLLTPVRIFRAAVNLINTKDGTDKYFRPRAHTNTHIQVNYEFLKDPAFRVVVGDLPSAMHNRLKNLLGAGKSVYTPVLGLAQCLADVNWLGEAEVRQGVTGKAVIDSVISLGKGITPIYEPGRRYHRTRIPATMDGERIVHRYQEILLADDAGPIECRIREPAEVYQVNDEIMSFL
ncbi:type I-B CRISPR-associated protein Cas5b [Desulfoferrobacter suflitae]|uniref:type I-B CRISPR-associated protein Cas5b n=1 Tax=Desulfoferrobacter suflitae TaxID=2865782 RepID=UPI002164813E|nr:type I-B CRISPR-associated protein Cas5b [Desulfoferrobacter suflitae]MCK8603805.1 type I-B CRISPR-associated protein Cas5b [Desulfoferrobacter suflitae]